MTDTFFIECECGKDVEFRLRDVDDLENHVNDLLDKEKTDTRTEVEREFEDYVHVDEVLDGRVLFELSAAIRRGDQAEAKLQLDRLVHDAGTSAKEQVELGWFSRRPAQAVAA